MGKNNKERRKNKKNKLTEKNRKKEKKAEAMFNDVTMFLDESGASGINYVDEVQPFYIQAGVIVQTDKIKKLEKAYLAWENKYKKKNQIEIKSDIFNRDNGFVIFNELYQEIKKFIISPTYAFVDKKYAIAFTLIESLLDFDYNAEVTEEIYYDSEKKVKWANQIYENIDNESLNMFNTSRGKSPSINEFSNAIEKLCDILDAKGLFELSKLLRAGDREYGYRFYSNDEDRKKASVNVLVFKNHYNVIRQEFFKKNLPKATIIHDEQLHYSKSFFDSVDAIESMPLHDFKVSNNRSLILGKFMDIKLQFSDASKSPVLKLADLICGYIRYSLERIFKGDKDFSTNSKPLFYLFWAPILRHDPRLNQNNDFPEWYYEGLPINMQSALYKYLFDFFALNKSE
jgi:MinD-like ATPase involved in chromosome partitioning or flagellar assembly